MRWVKKKLEKKALGYGNLPPPRLQSGGVLRRYPPVLDPEDLGIREKNFRAHYARAKKFFRGGMRGDNKKNFFRGDSKNQSTSHPHTLSTYTH